MEELLVDHSTSKSIIESFDAIAKRLFNEYIININEAYFRLIDIEFYYYSKQHHKDVYAHKHHLQAENGRWYFHPSGLDITIGGDENYGGVLIRGIIDITPGKPEREIHGPRNSKNAICSNLYSVFSDTGNTIKLIETSVFNNLTSVKIESEAFFKTRRINLNPTKEGGLSFCHENYRYVIQPHRRHKDKTHISKDMRDAGMEIAKINRLLGSKFL